MPDKNLFNTGELFCNSRTNYLCLLTILALLLTVTTANAKEHKEDFKFKEGHYYLLNQRGKINKQVEPFTFAEPFSEGLALVEKDLKFGFINAMGDIVINCQFYDAGSFSSDLAYAKQGYNYGFINHNGEFVIPPKFEKVTDFKGDYAMVLKSNPDTTTYGSLRWIFGYINKQGELMGDRYFTTISYKKKEGHFKATIKDTDFIISKDGIVTKEEKKEIDNTPVFYVVEELPEYPGGNNGLINHIVSNVRYPISAQERGITGKVYVNFIVDGDGNVCDVYPACKESAILMHEAVRLVKGLSQWKPGKQDGKAVKVSYTIPINFELR